MMIKSRSTTLVLALIALGIAILATPAPMVVDAFFITSPTTISVSKNQPVPFSIWQTTTKTTTTNTLLVVSPRRRDSCTTTQLAVTTPRKQYPLDVLERQYGEKSRKFRRDYFNHTLWVYHRAPNRFTRNISTLSQSGILRQLARETFLISFIATAIVVYNALFVAGFDDFAGIHHAALGNNSGNLPLWSLPVEPFTLSMPALSLLLGTYLIYCWGGDKIRLYDSPLILSHIVIINNHAKSFEPIQPTNAGMKPARHGVLLSTIPERYYDKHRPGFPKPIRLVLLKSNA